MSNLFAYVLLYFALFYMLYNNYQFFISFFQFPTYNSSTVTNDTNLSVVSGLPMSRAVDCVALLVAGTCQML